MLVVKTEKQNTMSEKNDSKHSPSSLLLLLVSVISTDVKFHQKCIYVSGEKVGAYLHVFNLQVFIRRCSHDLSLRFDDNALISYRCTYMNSFFRIEVGRILTRFAISCKIIESHEFNMKNRRDARGNDITALFLKRSSWKKIIPLANVCLTCL